MKKLILLVVLTVFLVGCSGSEQIKQSTPTPTPTVTPLPAPTGVSPQPTPAIPSPTLTPTATTQTPSPTPFQPSPTPTPLMFGVKYKVTVVKVIDGDTIDVRFENGEIERVRMLGIDTPETTADKNKVGEYDGITDLDCLAAWGKKAKQFSKQLEGKQAYIEFDSTAGLRGYYGRLLAYVYTDSVDFTAELVKLGYARVYEEGECKKEAEYLKYQEQAYNEKRGLWSCLTSSSPKPTPTSTAVVIKTAHYDACGDKSDSECLNDEFVVLENKGDTVNLQDWILSDEANHRYTFPNFNFESGATVTIHTGFGVDNQTDLYWNSGKPIWNNDHDTAYLYDPQGNLVDEFSW
ncbi:MAG: thermonuclease family protein [Archaeoglobus sp.]|nr:thermonuclease family protein [Archaeoglobus sp.]